MYKYNHSLRENSQELRKNMTPEEKRLWYDLLKLIPYPVKRQRVIESFILDFYIPSKRIAIEVDGRQHLGREHAEKDSERDAVLNDLGITIIRVSNEDITKRFNSTANYILDILGIKASELKQKNY